MLFLALFHLLLHVLPVTPYKYDPAYTGFNLNQNQTAVHPLDFWGGTLEPSSIFLDDESREPSAG
jgi:hypothetical protein